jgi:hypothetical protein
MSTTAATSMLNYANKRTKAMSATTERVKVPPQNGTSFQLQSTIDLRMPNMPKGSFLDMHNSYIKLNIRTEKHVGADAGAGDPAIAANPVSRESDEVFLTQNGVFALIERIEIISAAQTISVIDQYSKLAGCFLTTESDGNFKKGAGALQFGMGYDADHADKGVLLTPAGTGNGAQDNFFCFPLILTNLMSSSKYIPLFSSDNLIIRITLNSYSRGFVTGATVAGTAVTAGTCRTLAPVIQNVEMVNQIVKLDPIAAKLVDDSVGGVYQVVVDDWRNARSQIEASAQTLNVNLGYSFASLSRLIFAFYKTDYPNFLNDYDSENNRSHRFLSEYSFQLNGVNYPAQRLKADPVSNLSEVVAEIRGSTRQSLDFSHQMCATRANWGLNNVAGKATNVGQSLYEIDLEGLRSYQENDVYSGLYTIGGVTSVDATMSAGGGAPMELNVWAQFQATLTLDTRGDNIFTYQS